MLPPFKTVPARISASLALFALLAGTPCAQAQNGPPISWSVPKLERVISDRFWGSATVMFTSSQALTDVVVSITPELQSFMTVAPAVLAQVPANQPQALSLIIDARQTHFTSTTVEGSIQLRSNGDKRLWPRPLPIVFTVSTMSFGKAATPNPVMGGQIVTFSIVLYNAGNVASQAVQVTDTLQGGLTFVSCSTSIGQCAPPSGNTVSVVAGSISPGVMERVTIEATAPLVTATTTIPNRASFTLNGLDAGWTEMGLTVTGSIPGVPVITSIVPSSAAAGFGQLIAIFGQNFPTWPTAWEATPPHVAFTQGAVSAEGFAYPTPSTPGVLFARLPFIGDGFTTTPLAPGAASVRVVVGGNSSNSQPLTVSAIPGQPVVRWVFGLTNPPTTTDPCSGLASETPINTVRAGQGIAISAYGIDTVGVSALFTQGGTSIEVTGSCGMDSGVIGEASSIAVPTSLVPGLVTVSVRAFVNGVPSPFSDPVTLTVVP